MIWSLLVIVILDAVVGLVIAFKWMGSLFGTEEVPEGGTEPEIEPLIPSSGTDWDAEMRGMNWYLEFEQEISRQGRLF